jgi:large subunit ribosomal protein L7A
MFTELKKDNTVVGTKQVLRGLNAQTIQRVYIANDTDDFLKNRLIGACQAQNVEIIFAQTMQELGKACGISVGTAVCGLLKP